MKWIFRSNTVHNVTRLLSRLQCYMVVILITMLQGCYTGHGSSHRGTHYDSMYIGNHYIGLHEHKPKKMKHPKYKHHKYH